jgi:hypothetical protein
VTETAVTETTQALAVGGTASERPQAAAAGSPVAAHDETLCTSKIMIVDDEPINVKVARKYLMLEGYRNFGWCRRFPNEYCGTALLLLR